MINSRFDIHPACECYWLGHVKEELIECFIEDALEQSLVFLEDGLKEQCFALLQYTKQTACLLQKTETKMRLKHYCKQHPVLIAWQNEFEPSLLATERSSKKTNRNLIAT